MECAANAPASTVSTAQSSPSVLDFSSGKASWLSSATTDCTIFRQQQQSELGAGPIFNQAVANTLVAVESPLYGGSCGLVDMLESV